MKNFKKEFPFLQSESSEKPLVYFDSAATTPKPQCVINALTDAYTHYTAPVHRGIYEAAEMTTAYFEQTRATVAQFFNAASPKEIIFTSGTTESLNLVAFGFFAHQLKKGDEIVISELEHNANVIPWQQVAQKIGALLRYLPITKEGDLHYASLEQIITKKTKIVSVTHASNAIGTLVDIDCIIKRAKDVGALICIDAAQTAGHIPLDVQALNIDFLVCSSHKMYGPYGVGILYAKQTTHDYLFPLRFGGGIVAQVTHHAASLLPVPARLEAGTPPIAEIIAFGTAVTYLQANFNVTQQQESLLFQHLLSRLAALPHIRIIGNAQRLNVVSIIVDGHHAHDIATLLDQHNIAVRAGTHCAHVVAQCMNYTASVRISLGMYNDMSDIDQLINLLKSMEFHRLNTLYKA